MGGRRVTPRWLEAYEAVLDTYLGKVPANSLAGQDLYAHGFRRRCPGPEPDDYVELTSYEPHPYYQKCRLEIPDNWTYNSDYYNLPIDELEAVVEKALAGGYSVVWDGDVSEKDFSTRETG